MHAIGSPSRLMALSGVLAFMFAAAWYGSTRGRGPVGGQAPGAQEAAIRAARVAQNLAIVNRDLDAIAAVWTDDVTIRRGLGQPVQGRAAYRQLYAPTGAYDAEVIYQRAPATVEVSAQWPLAYESGTWAGHLGGVAGPTVIAGRYSAQWVRRDGKWLIRSEVFVALTCSGVGCSYSAVP